MKYILNKIKPITCRLLCALTILPIYSHASICTNLGGSWLGEWQDEQRNVMPARLLFVINENNEFTGTFLLQDGGKGTLAGSCVAISNNEAYITLKPDAPAYNPCRGTMLVDKEHMETHFFCFNPNQSGYFSK